MQYALLGDLHSHTKRTKTVLNHIQESAPQAQIYGLGDLFECVIGKKKAQTTRGVSLQEAAIYSQKFEDLLTFPSIIGNQEERIALVTGLKQFLQYPNELKIEHATLVHGHQFHWNEKFEPTFPAFETPVVFFGHSHRAAIYEDGVRKAVPYDEAIYIGNQQTIVNVGAVVETCDWCLYDSEAMTVTFKRAQ